MRHDKQMFLLKLDSSQPISPETSEIFRTKSLRGDEDILAIYACFCQLLDMILVLLRRYTEKIKIFQLPRSPFQTAK